MNKMNSMEKIDATITRGAGMKEEGFLSGRYTVSCVGADGQEKWAEEFDNFVCDAGKALLLDTFLAGSAYTTVGPFMGLYKSGAPAANTVMSFVTANETTAIAARVSLAGNFSAASGAGTVAKALTTAKAISITGTDTILGCFIVTGTGAVATLASTAGTMYSIGAFGASKAVTNGDTLNVSYSTSL
jgi:hypothetical protein